MGRFPVLCPRCHPDQVMKGGKTKVHICNTTAASYRDTTGQTVAAMTEPGLALAPPRCPHTQRTTVRTGRRTGAARGAWASGLSPQHHRPARLPR